TTAAGLYNFPIRRIPPMVHCDRSGPPVKEQLQPGRKRATMGAGFSGASDPPREKAAMPIRFRCAYCNQLMGIARRKAGNVVRCPTCAGQVVVPQTDLAAAAGALKPSNGAEQPLFERSDFDELFKTSDSDDPAVIGPRP